MDIDPLRAAIAAERTQKVIRSKALSVVLTLGLPLAEVEDLAQFITLYVLERAGRYDPGRAGIATFIDRGIGWAIRAYLRAQGRQKRGGGAARPLSLDAPARRRDPDGASLGDAVEDGAGGRAPHVPEGAIQRRNARVHEVIAALPHAEAALARGFMAGLTESGAAAESGISRRRARALAERLRALFEKADLDGF